MSDPLGSLTPSPPPKQTWWQLVVKFFKDSEVIFFARFQMFLSAMLAVLAVMDFSPLVSAGVPSKQQWVLYAILFAQGMITELARRRRATDM